MLETYDCHSLYYLDLASAYEQKLKSARQQTAMREMTGELDNMRKAWDWGIIRRRFELLGEAVRSFGWYFEVAGLIRDGIDQLELLVRVLSDIPRDTQMDRTLGTTLVQQGLLYFRLGHFVRAQELYRKAIGILRPLNEGALLADALIFNGTITHLNGDYIEARKLIVEGLAYAREVNDRWFVAFGIYNLGHVDSLLGEYQKGYDQMQEGMKIWRELGDPHSISLGLNFLVNTQIKLERFEEAKASMWESISLCEQTKNRWGMGTAYRFLGLATLAEGQYTQAADFFRKSLEIFGEYYEGWDIALSLIYLGDATLMAGDLASSEKAYWEALQLAQKSGSTSLILDALAGLAILDVHAGNNERAWEITSFILRHPSSTNEAKDRASGIQKEAGNHISLEQTQRLEGVISNRSLEEMLNMLI